MRSRNFGRRGRDFAREVKRGEAPFTRAKFTPDASIDLHGLHPDDAMRRLRQAVEGGVYRGEALAVIHGKGRGILRERTRRYGAGASEVKRVWNGEDVPLPEGDGVTIFFL